MEPRPVIWFEIWVNDVERAKAFYAALFGWTFQAMPDYSPDYWLIGVGDGSYGGALWPSSDVGPASAASSGTLVYVSVADLDATVVQAKALGARLDMPPTAIGTSGSRFAIIRDPRGIRIGVWQR